MAKISQKTIDLIKDTADIVDVVSEFVPLQTAGKNMKGLCPFHSEKTPSFFVSKERQIFNCFGCGKKGNVISFIQEYKHLGFVDALKYLADKYHIEIEVDQFKRHDTVVDNLYLANQKALDFYSLNLLNMTKGKEALNYLISRGLDVDTIQTFELGFAPSESTALFNQLKNEFQPLELVNAGLINRGKDDYYDLFRGRIMFPIRDESNRVIAFSGRVFKEDNPAKYVNTPQTEIFSKSNTIYNLHRAIPDIQRLGRVVLMEGFMDVIKSSIAGVKEAVCSMGTQLTIDQAKKLKKYTNNVIICYDGDRAGKEATYKAIKLLESESLNVQIALIPDGMDPDEFISKHPNFQEFLDNSLKDQYEFVYQMILEDKDLSKPAAIEKAKNQLFDFFAKTSGTIRDIYFNKFSHDSLVDLETLKADYRQTRINQRITESLKSSVNRQRKPHKRPPMFEKAEKVIINYYIHDVDFRKYVDENFDSLYFKNSDNFNFIMTAMDVNKVYNGESFIAAIKASLSDIYREKLDLLRFDSNYLYTKDEFDSCINILKIARLEDEISIKEDKAKQYNINISEEKNEFFKCKAEIIDLKSKIHDLKNSDKK